METRSFWLGEVRMKPYEYDLREKVVVVGEELAGIIAYWGPQGHDWEDRLGDDKRPSVKLALLRNAAGELLLYREDWMQSSEIPLTCSLSAMPAEDLAPDGRLALLGQLLGAPGGLLQ